MRQFHPDSETKAYSKIISSLLREKEIVQKYS